MTDRSVAVHFPHESDIQASMFSDVFSQIGSRFNPSHSRTDIHASVTAISTADKGIDAAMQFVRSLLTRRNALVPISHLPPEILSRVFHLLVLAEPSLFGGRSLGWIRVTHVCRHWRQVALDDSSLWAKIWGIPKNPTKTKTWVISKNTTKWISGMLARAKNAPLDIQFNAVTGSSAKALLMILPHLSHARRLIFHNLSTRLHLDSVREIHSREAPTLEHFELTVYAHSPITFPDLDGNMLFKGHTPRLRTFSLSQVLIPWSLIPRGQLTQLKVACPNGDVDYPGELDQLIDLLVNCPALKVLELESCLPSQLTELPNSRTIHLSHLSRLRLCGSTSRITNMLKMLKLPSSTTLHLDCISKITSLYNDPESLLLAVISAQFQSPAPVEFKSLTVTIGCQIPNSLRMTASTFPSTSRNHQTEYFEGDIVGNTELVLLFVGLSKPGHSTDLLEQACKMLSISNLEFLSLSATDIIGINWVELFGCCTNVASVEASGHGTSSLVRALTAPRVTNAGPSKGGRKRESRGSTREQLASTVAHAHPGIFPKLKSLELVELNFSEGEHPSDVLFDVFERGLQQRMATSEGSLKLLSIKYCDISSEHADDLKNLVQDFDWDGNEGLIDGIDHHNDDEDRLYAEDILDSLNVDWDSDDLNMYMDRWNGSGRW